MVEEPPHPAPPGEEPRERHLPSWRRVGDFILNVFELQRAVKTLQTQLKEQQVETQRLQRMVERQAGQLEAVMSFINTSLRDQMETRAERAAMRLFQQLIDVKTDPPAEDR